MNTTAIENQEIKKIKPNQGSDKGEEDWVSCKLGEVCSIQTGKYDANHAKPDGKYRFYTCAFDYLKCHTNRFKGKSIILPGNGANVGEVFFYDGEFDAYQRTYVLNQIKINEKYLYFHLLGFWKTINLDKQFGTATNYIRMANFTDYTLPIFPLPIQRAIVKKIEELFSSLDSGIADLKKAQEQLVIYRQAVLKKAFEGDYSSKKIIEIADVNTGATPKRGNSKFWNNGTIPWVTSTVVNNDFVNEPSELITEEAIKQTNCKLIPKGSLLIAMYGEGKTRGKCSELNIDTATNQALAGITLFEKHKDSKQFVKWFFVKNYEKIRLLSSGGVQPNLNLTIIKNTIIPFPEPKEQIKIVREIESRLSVCDKVEESITESLEKAQALRQSILKKAFEGKLLSEAEIEQCKQEKDYEPASVLLKKLKN